MFSSISPWWLVQDDVKIHPESFKNLPAGDSLDVIRIH
jgi:hypothetical protein